MSAPEWGLLLLLSLVWGGSFFFAAVALEDLSPLRVVFFRVAGAAVLLWLVMCVRAQRIPRRADVWGALFVMGFLNNVVPFSLIVWAQTDISSGLASILNATTPIFTLLVANALTLDEKLTPARLCGVLLGFGGVAVLLGGPGAQGAYLPMLAVLGAALSYGFASVWGKRFRGLGLSPMATATGQVSASSLMLVPLVVFLDGPLSLALPSTATLAALAGLAAVSTAFAYLLYFRILSSAGATNLSLVTLLIPPSAILLGVLFLAEVPTGRQMAGLAVIGLGLLVIDGRVLRLGRVRR